MLKQRETRARLVLIPLILDEIEGRTRLGPCPLGVICIETSQRAEDENPRRTREELEREIERFFGPPRKSKDSQLR